MNHPFRIMYRRMAKKYPGLPDSVKITTNYLPKGIYKNVYVGRLYATHVWDYKEHWELIDGNLPDNLFVSIGAGGGMVVGTPVESGTYNFTLALSIIIARDTWISADTMDYCLVIENNPPQFVSTDSVSASVGANLSYIAEAIDPDENVLSYNFINKPYWLSPQDSLLSGTVPVNACDTSFTVLTTDGELTDSLKVKIHITQQNSALPEKQNNIPHTFYLQQNFPNPFNAETKIKFTLSRQDLTNISIYNLSGKKIAELMQQHLPPGHYSVIWNAKNQPSGIYFIKLTSGSFQTVKKCILVK